jgi:ribosome-binding protein aMBF1 (putative translation factor)
MGLETSIVLGHNDVSLHKRGSVVPKTIDDLMKVIWKEAREAGPGAVRRLRALDRYLASEVAKDLSRLREKRALTQAELGRRAKVQPADVSRILSGKSNPRLRTVEKLAHAVGAQVRIVSTTSARVARTTGRGHRTQRPKR